MIAAAIIAAALAAEPAQPENQAQLFIEDAKGWLLDGKDVPRDYRLRLLAMDPAERMRALVWLRRAGMLNEKPWSVEDLTRPAATDEKDLDHERNRGGR